MKLIVDIIEAGQKWIPETGEQVNYVTIALAGQPVVLHVSEEYLGAVITQCATQGFQGDLEGGEEHEAQAEGWDGYEEKPQLPSSGLAGLVDAVYAEEEEAGGEDESFSPGVFEPVTMPVSARDDYAVVEGLSDVLAQLKASVPQRAPAPPSATQQRKAAIKASSTRAASPERERIAQMREKARQHPPRRLPADAAGNPIVSGAIRHLQEQHTQAPAATNPLSDGDDFAQG